MKHFSASSGKCTLTPRQFFFCGIVPRTPSSLERKLAADHLFGRRISVDDIAPQVEGKFISAFIRATKPSGKFRSEMGL
jgi:hypothetical protein